MKFTVRTGAASLAAVLSLAACSGGDAITSAAAPESPLFNEASCSNINLPFVTSVRAGLEPTVALEIDGKLDTPCGYMVLTGLGGRISTGSNFTGLQLTGRYVYPDGTMGPAGDMFFGNMPSGPEEYASIPAGYAVVGVSIGQVNDDVNRIELRYRKVELVNGAVQLTGSVLTATAGSGTPEAAYTLSGSDSTRVIVGAGFRSAVDKVKTMALHVASLQ